MAQAAIFDMDGLLVDSEPFWRTVTVEVMDSLGSDVRPLLDRGATKGMRVDESVALFRALVPWDEAVGESLVGDDEIMARIVDGVVSAIKRGVALMPGAVEALDWLEEKGLRLALATGSVPPVVTAVLDAVGLHDRFEVIRSAVEVPLGKPHPAIFLETAAALGVEAGSCVVLEDSVNGCIAGKAARMRVVAVPAAEDRGDRRFCIADLVLDSLEEFPGEATAALLGIDGAAVPVRRTCD